MSLKVSCYLYNFPWDHVGPVLLSQNFSAHLYISFCILKTLCQTAKVQGERENNRKTEGDRKRREERKREREWGRWQQQDAWTVSQRPVQCAVGRGLPWSRECFLCPGCECVRGQSWTDTVAIVLRWLTAHFLSLTRCWGQTDDPQGVSVCACVQAYAALTINKHTVNGSGVNSRNDIHSQLNVW